MIQGWKKTVTEIFLSPEELRSIAGFFEQRLKKIKLGEPLPHHKIYLEDGSHDEIIIQCKQEFEQNVPDKQPEND